MLMKKTKNIFLALLVFNFVFTLGFISKSSFAQDAVQTGKPECLDGEDNDNDKKIDFGNKADNDPDCVSTSDNSESTPGMQEQKSGSSRDVKINIKIKNPIGVNTIEEAIKKIMDVILSVALPFIVLFFIYAGFLFVTARGDKTKLEKAKNMFWYTLIGALLILGAWTIATAVVNTVNEITS